MNVVRNHIAEQPKLNESPSARLRTMEIEDELDSAGQLPNVAGLVKLKSGDMRAIGSCASMQASRQIKGYRRLDSTAPSRGSTKMQKCSAGNDSFV